MTVLHVRPVARFGKTKGMKDWEETNQRDLKGAIIEAIEETGSTAQAALRMGLTHVTLRDWTLRLGILITARAVVLDSSDAPMSAAG